MCTLQDTIILNFHSAERKLLTCRCLRSVCLRGRCWRSDRTWSRSTDSHSSRAASPPTLRAANRARGSEWHKERQSESARTILLSDSSHVDFALLQSPAQSAHRHHHSTFCCVRSLFQFGDRQLLEFTELRRLLRVSVGLHILSGTVSCQQEPARKEQTKFLIGKLTSVGFFSVNLQSATAQIEHRVQEMN